MNEIRLATRRSRLALAQTRRVADLLESAHPGLKTRFVEVTTSGDLDQEASIASLTEAGAFVRAVQEAVTDKRADLAVHSLKDLPVAGPGDLVIAALAERASPHDVLVGSRLDELDSGDLVGTGSPRRAAQLALLSPGVRTVELRGNVDTRLDKIAAGEVRAAVLAEAGLGRLGLSEKITQRLSIDEMVPAPGQGVLAVEARKGTDAEELARTMDDARLRSLVEAERLLLAETGAGCRSALGALAIWCHDLIRLEAFVADERGSRRAIGLGESPFAVVAEVRKELGL